MKLHDIRLFSHKNFTRIKSIRIALFLPLILILPACGIESVSYLLPPQLADIDEPLSGESIFIFLHNSSNNASNHDVMRGYEIYYKFYPVNQTTEYENEISQIDANIETNRIVGPAPLESSGYLRLYGKDPDDLNYQPDEGTSSLLPPLIPISDKDIDHRIELDFLFITESQPAKIFIKEESTDLNGNEIYITQNEIEAVRYVKNEPEGDLEPKFYTFYREDLTTEYTDFSEDLVADDETEVLLSLYVLTHGKEDIFQDLYSEAVHLGRITINVSEVQP
jgi:hypothetical protein